MSGLIQEIVALLCVPILTGTAWVGWAKNGRTEMPPWRNGFALTGLLFITMNWLVAVLVSAQDLSHHYLPGVDSVAWTAYLLSHPLSVVAVICALAPKRRVRIEAVIAGLLMLLCWPVGYA
jgi:hypothetical protein